jgi:NAD(P)-dependent dehydrogenase (short-subunit alcohol dehydrogenase family)
MKIPSPFRFLARFIIAAACLTTARAGEPAPAPATIPAGTKIILVTGSTDGLGREVALRLAATGAHVIVHGRNRERGAEVVKTIEQDGKGSARFYAADLAALAQVREFAAALRRDYRRLDVLVNNAGIWLADNTRRLSADGHEMHFAVNYLAGAVLARELLPLLEAAAPARIVNVASAAQNALDFDDLMLARNYSDSRGYATSKLAQVMLTFDLARELAPKRISVYALHPATLMNTGMVANHDLAPRATTAEGAAAVLQLVTGDNLENGGYYNGLRPARANAQAYDLAAREQLKLATALLLAR